MKSYFLSRFFSNESLNILAWTLIHSIWIGVLVAALSGLMLSLTRKSSALLRYRLLCGALTAFLLITGVVSINLYSRHGDESQGREDVPVIPLPGKSPDNVIDVVYNGTMIDFVINFINQHVPEICFLWLTFFLFKSFSLVSGLFYLRKIRTTGLYEVSDDYPDKIKAFSRQLGIKRPVRLWQSSRVNVPLTLGYLKPLILLPLGLITELPPQQIDTILWHELAHIYRRDYLVNLLQNLVETVFFFNPGILWLSAQIREERENCCDDMVLAHTSPKSDYLEALLAFHSFEKTPAHARMVLGLKGNQLSKRLKRIIYNENKRLNTMEKTLFVAGVLAVSAFTFLPKEFNTPPISASPTVIKPDERPSPVKSAEMQISGAAGRYESLSPADSAKKLKSISFPNGNGDKANQQVIGVMEENGNQYVGKFTDGKMTELLINDRVVPESEYSKHQDLYNKIMKEWEKARQAKQKNKLTTLKDPEDKAAKADRKDKIMFKAESEKEDFEAVEADELSETEREDKILQKEKKKNGKAKTQKDSPDKLTKIEKDRRYELKADKKGNNDKLLKIEKDGKYQLKEDKKTAPDKLSKIEKDGKYELKEDGKVIDDKLAKIEKDGKYRVKKDQKATPGKLSKIENGGKHQLKEEKKGGADKLNKIEKEDKNRTKPNDEALNKKLKRLEGLIGQKPGINHPDIAADQARVRGVIDGLIDAKAVSSAREVEWFGLSTDELVLNGRKLPHDLQTKLKNKFGIKPGYGLYYGPVKMSGTGVFLDKDQI